MDSMEHPDSSVERSDSSDDSVKMECPDCVAEPSDAKRKFSNARRPSFVDFVKLPCASVERSDSSDESVNLEYFDSLEEQEDEDDEKAEMEMRMMPPLENRESVFDGVAKEFINRPHLYRNAFIEKFQQVSF